MNIKKIATVLLSVATAVALLAGCGGNSEKKSAGGPKVDQVRVGMLTHLNASEQKINEIYKKIDESAGARVKFAHDYVYYDKLASMQMGLESASVGEMSLYDSVAKYLIGHNDKMEISEHPGLKLQDSFCLALRAEDSALKADLDKAISDMTADGTLGKLTKTYITDLKQGTEPPAVPIENIAGAPVLKVAVTGDLPPLDLVLANGKPAGFNTAVLSEISKRIGKNIEMVQIDSAARATTLVSKKVDIVFWATVPYGETIVPNDIDKPEGLDLTKPYFMDNIVHVKLKNVTK